MDHLYAPPPPQGPKRTEKLKSIFEDDALLIEKCREYLQSHQDWQRSKVTGDGQYFMFPTEIAEKLKISIEDATELKEFAHRPEYGESERDHIFNTPHISLDHNGNEIPKLFYPFGFGEPWLCTQRKPTSSSAIGGSGPLSREGADGASGGSYRPSTQGDVYV